MLPINVNEDFFYIHATLRASILLNNIISYTPRTVDKLTFYF